MNMRKEQLETERITTSGGISLENIPAKRKTNEEANIINETV